MKHKLALITGSSSGLGLAIAKKCKKLGIEVYAPTRKDGFDLTDVEAVSEICEWIEQNAPDLIFNCAGKGLYGPMLSHPYHEEQELIDLNISTLTKISYKAAHTLIKEKKKGIIVNISSIAALIPFPTLAVYAATKSYVKNFSLAFDDEVQDKGVRVLCSCPGMFSSNFAKTASKSYFKKETSRRTPERLTDLIFWQIQKKQRLSIPFFGDKMSLLLTKILPKRVVFSALKKAIRNRYPQSANNGDL